MKENDAMENQRQETPQVRGFTPIDIFAPPPKKYRLAEKRLPGKRYYPAKPQPAQAEPPGSDRLTPAEEADALYLHAVGGGWVSRLLAALVPAFAPLAASLLYHGVVLALPPLRRAAGDPVMADKMRFKRPPAFAAMLAALSGLAAALAAPALTAAWSGLLGLLGLSFPAPDIGWSSAPLLLVRSAILAGIGEEIFFRGYLLSAWEDRRGWHCVPITALLFALTHGSVQGFPAQLAMGLFLGMICVRSGSVVCAALAHVAYNAGAILLSAAWSASGAVQLAAAALCGAALSAAFYWLMTRATGRKAANIPSGAASGWQGALALYAGAATALAAYVYDLATLLG